MKKNFEKKSRIALIALFFIFAATAGAMRSFKPNSSQAAVKNSMCTADSGMILDSEIVFLIDRSDSMAPYYDHVKQAINQFLFSMGSYDRSALISFASDVTVDQNLSSDHNDVGFALDAISFGGATAIGPAIDAAIAILDNSDNPQSAKEIILLTDGKADMPNGGGTGENAQDVLLAETAATSAGSSGYRVYAIGLGADVNADMLQNLASYSGGSVSFASDSLELSDIYSAISQNICELSSIQGCIYTDADRDGAADGDSTITGSIIYLSSGYTYSQATDETGCYLFAGLDEAEYSVYQATSSSYAQTSPNNDEAQYVNLGAAENREGIDFANYPVFCGDNYTDGAETCDDGNTVNGDGCSSECLVEDDGSGQDGGGGGSGDPAGDTQGSGDSGSSDPSADESVSSQSAQSSGSTFIKKQLPPVASSTDSGGIVNDPDQDSSSFGVKVLSAIGGFADNTLVRDENLKIFMISGNFKYYIDTLEKLAKFIGQKIYEVSSSDIAPYRTRLLFPGELIRKKDEARIYVITKDGISLIPDLNTLRLEYFGKKIHNLSASDFLRYE